MKSKLAITALCLLPLASQTAVAEEAKDASELTMSAELGFLFKSGNTKSGDIKAGFNVKHKKNQWTNLLAVNALAKKLEEKDDETGDKEFVTTDNKWDLKAQTNYALHENGKNYLYANLGYQQDKFSGFESQSSLSAGWGRHWIDTETSSLFADIGPGVKYDVIRQTDTQPENEETNFIVQAQALYTTKINEFVEFKQYLVAKQTFESGKNSVYQSETSITTKLIESMQLKFALRIDYDTEVEPEFENTNTETSLTLVYNF